MVYSLGFLIMIFNFDLVPSGHTLVRQASGFWRQLTHGVRKGLFMRAERVFRQFFVVALVVLWTASAWADQKPYVWTYDYSTLARDSTEIEYYQTSVVKDRNISSASDWEQQIEFGVRDHRPS